MEVSFRERGYLYLYVRGRVKGKVYKLIACNKTCYDVWFEMVELTGDRVKDVEFQWE